MCVFLLHYYVVMHLNYYFNYSQRLIIVGLMLFSDFSPWYKEPAGQHPQSIAISQITVLLLARLMGQYCFARCRLSASSVTRVAGPAADTARRDSTVTRDVTRLGLGGGLKPPKRGCSPPKRRSGSVFFQCQYAACCSLLCCNMCRTKAHNCYF